MAMTLLPWLLVGGTLALHHPFDGATFAQQCRDLHCDAVVVPGPLVAQLAAAGDLSQLHQHASVIAAWRAPEQLRRAADWRRWLAVADRRAAVRGDRPDRGAARERRQAGADSARCRSWRRGARRARSRSARSPRPRAARSRCAAPWCRRARSRRARSEPRSRISPSAADGFVDTGYAAEIGREAGTLVVSGPPAGLVSFGGYRFAVAELTGLVNGLDPSGTLAVRPDALAGHRLAGTAANPEAIRMALRGIGANPLLVEAFAARTKPVPKTAPQAITRSRPHAGRREPRPPALTRH